MTAKCRPMRNGSLILVFLIFFTSFAQGQSEEERPGWTEGMSLNGYMKYLNQAFIPGDSGELITDNFFHNRLNYAWDISDNFRFNASARSRFFWGELVRNLGVSQQVAQNQNWLDLDVLWMEGDSYAFHTILDRLFLTMEKDKFELVVGRQRVNWGMTLIWNPNDIFNTYSFFDFDYEERPGTDAIQVNYYSSFTSELGLVYELADSLQGSKLGARYRWNMKGYDFQVLGGYQTQFFVAGLGWAGDIAGAGFRGEATYFIPEAGLDVEDQLVGSIDLDYAFSNQINLVLQTSYLFNSVGLNARRGDYTAFYLERAFTAQTLSPARHNLLFQARGQLSPIVTTTIATIINPRDGSSFMGPTVDWSVAENLDFLLAGQFFLGPTSTLYGDGGAFLFMRFKYSF